MSKRIIALLLAFAMLATLSGCKMSDYKSAVELYDSGAYSEAKEAFDLLEDYKDSAEKSQLCQNQLDYQSGKNAMSAGEYEEAMTYFNKCLSFSDSKDCITQCNYAIGEQYMTACDYENAKAYYQQCGGYKDSADKIAECEYSLAYNEANGYKFSGDYDSAYDAFTAISAEEDAIDCKYLKIITNIDDYVYEPDRLSKELAELGSYRDCDKLSAIFDDIYHSEFIAAAEKIIDFLQTSDELPEYSWWEDYFDYYIDYNDEDDYLQYCAAQQLISTEFDYTYYTYGCSISDFSRCNGTDGKILVCSYDHSMGNDSTNICSSNRFLPFNRIPQSMEEVQYVIMIEEGHNTDCTYDSGTIGVVLWTKIYIVEYPSGKTMKNFGTAYGGYPPYSFSYYGSAPTYKSGGSPDTSEVDEMYKEALEYLSVYRKEGEYTYSVYNEEASLLDVDNELTEIPAYLGGYPLVRVCGNMCYCGSEEEIVLPDTLRIFESNLFGALDSGVRKITLPSSLYMIPSYAFDFNTSLEEVIIPEGVNYISPGAFTSCYNLKNLTIPSSVRCFSFDGFEYGQLESIVFNEGLRFIYGYSAEDYYDEADIDDEYVAAYYDLLHDEEEYNSVLTQFKDFLAAIEEDESVIFDIPEFMLYHEDIFYYEILTLEDAQTTMSNGDFGETDKEILIENLEYTVEALEAAAEIFGIGEAMEVEVDDAALSVCHIPDSVVLICESLPDYFEYSYTPGSCGEWYMQQLG